MTTLRTMSDQATGRMPDVLRKALNSLPARGQELWLEHLHGGTSADYLADWLKRAGVPVSATTIKKYRREVTND